MAPHWPGKSVKRRLDWAWEAIDPSWNREVGGLGREVALRKKFIQVLCIELSKKVIF